MKEGDGTRFGRSYRDLFIDGILLGENGKGEKYGQENNALCRYRVIEISRIDRAE